MYICNVILHFLVKMVVFFFEIYKISFVGNIWQIFRVLKYFNMLYTIRNILCMKSSWYACVCTKDNTKVCDRIIENVAKFQGNTSEGVLSFRMWRNPFSLPNRFSTTASVTEGLLILKFWNLILTFLSRS